jgi:two-component system, OmpR family, response regulator
MATVLRSIMLVEDEPDIQEVARLSLESFGKFKVHICSNGQEALDSVESIKPDLIMLDMMMPGMDGLTTLKLLRENASLQNIPVIFMTAKAQANEMKQYIEKGAIGAISKPFDPIKLVSDIKEIWDAKT